MTLGRIQEKSAPYFQTWLVEPGNPLGNPLTQAQLGPLRMKESAAKRQRRKGAEMFAVSI